MFHDFPAMAVYTALIHFTAEIQIKKSQGWIQPAITGGEGSCPIPAMLKKIRWGWVAIYLMYFDLFFFKGWGANPDGSPPGKGAH